MGKNYLVSLSPEKNGNKNASIASLYLNPLQLRICEIVAIGTKREDQKINIPKLQFWKTIK